MEEIKCALLVVFALWAIFATLIARRLATQCKDKDAQINELINSKPR